jgi:hypothetical protein
MANSKGEVITFKVDQSLLAAMGGIENRSEFIRAAVMNALDGACPLCKGTGSLTPNQKSHWNAFRADHIVEECGECHELRLVCSHGPRKNPHARKAKRA